MAFVLWHACMFEQVSRHGPRVRPLAVEFIAGADEQGFPLWRAVGVAFHGWALAEQGQLADGNAQIEEGLAAFRATGAVIFLPYWFALLAEARTVQGRISEGLELLAEAVDRALATDERWFEAELLRLKGKLLLFAADGIPSEAETCFVRAIDVARAQSARTWELRAAVSLARLWRDQGKRNEARDLLAPVYGWFTEGFDTPDLKEAKTLLDELR
jgi:predicted ATPase